MTGIRPGEQYDPQKIARSRQRLQDLGVFASVSVEEGAIVGPDGVLPLTFVLTERKRHLIGAGASYSTLDGATLEGYWMHRNLFGHAESLRFDAELSRIGADDLEDFSYELATTFRRPGVFTPNTDATLKLEAEREDVDPYESTSFSGKVGLEHRFSPELLGSTALNGELDEIDDAFGNNEYLLVSLPSKLDYDGRDNRLDPTRGFRAILEAEPFADIKAGTLALVSEGGLAGYYGIGAEDRLVFAARGSLGTIVGGDTEEIPATRRFFLGGGGSIRGYEYRIRRSAGERRGGRRPVLLRNVARASLPCDRHDRHRALHRCRRRLRGSDPGFLRRRFASARASASATTRRSDRSASTSPCRSTATMGIPSRFTSAWGNLSDDAESIRQNAPSSRRPHRLSLCSRSRFGAADAQDGGEKSGFVRFLESSLSTPDRRISLDGVEDVFSWNPKIARITVADRDGAWLQLEGVEVVWTRSALAQEEARHRRAAGGEGRGSAQAASFGKLGGRQGCLRATARDRHRYHRAAASVARRAGDRRAGGSVGVRLGDTDAGSACGDACGRPAGPRRLAVGRPALRARQEHSRRRSEARGTRGRARIRAPAAARPAGARLGAFRPRSHRPLAGQP